jgi:hypothetical protein
MAVIDSLVAKLSFDFDGKALEQFNQGMADAGKAIAVVAAGAATAGAAIFAFTSKIAEQNDEVGKLAQTIGITAQSISELGFVAELNGGSVNSMNTSLENLAKVSSEAARGMGAGVEAFGLLGVSATTANGSIKKADDLLLDVADAISQLDSQSQKLELLNKLGIDSSMLLTLEQGSAAIRRQREEVKALGFVLDKDATESAAKFNDEMLRIGTVAKGVASSIGTKLMKQITPMISAFLEWFKANKEIIKQNLNGFFEKLTKVITAVVGVAQRIFNVVNTVAQAFGGWTNAIGAVSAALLAMNIRILLIPALILAAGVAIFLLIEDIIAFANGADSQMGALAEKSSTFKIILESLVEVFAMVGEGWRLIFTDGEAAFEGLIIIIKDIGQAIADFIMAPINAVTDAFESLKNKTSGLIGEAGDALEGGLESVSNFFGGNDTPQAALVSPLNTTSNNTTTTNDVTVNIQGGDPSAVKQAVSEALGAEFKTAEKNVSTNIIY